MNKKQLKYVLRIGREYDQRIFDAEVLAAGMVNARPDYQFPYVVATWFGAGWNFDYHRTVREAIKHGGLNAKYFLAVHFYSHLLAVSHDHMMRRARWEVPCR
jgi:hypothetical protein